MSAELNENTLSDMISELDNAFTEERQKSEPYKEMFKAGSTHIGLLRDLQHKMVAHVFDACEVFKERHGVKINNKQYHVLLALPILAKIAEKNVSEKEGITCCVDKAYFLLSDQLIELGKDTS